MKYKTARNRRLRLAHITEEMIIMGRRSITIDEKIKKQKEVIAISKDKYEAALDELNLLIKKKQDLQGKELLTAFVNSDKSLDEILAYMGEKHENKE